HWGCYPTAPGSTGAPSAPDWPPTTTPTPSTATCSPRTDRRVFGSAAGALPPGRRRHGGTGRRTSTGRGGRVEGVLRAGGRGCPEHPFTVRPNPGGGRGIGRIFSWSPPLTGHGRNGSPRSG